MGHVPITKDKLGANWTVVMVVTTISLLFFLLFVFLCLFDRLNPNSPYKEVSRFSIGKILSSEVVPSSRYEYNRTYLHTESYNLLLQSNPAVPVHAEAFIVTDSRNRQWVTWEGSTMYYSF